VASTLKSSAVLPGCRFKTLSFTSLKEASLTTWKGAEERKVFELSSGLVQITLAGLFNLILSGAEYKTKTGSSIANENQWFTDFGIT
jgi:hypothetical protein